MTSEQATPKAMIIHILIIVSVSCYALQSNLSCNEGKCDYGKIKSLANVAILIGNTYKFE